MFWSELRKAALLPLAQKLFKSLCNFELNRCFSRMPVGKDDGKL